MILFACRWDGIMPTLPDRHTRTVHVHLYTLAFSSSCHYEDYIYHFTVSVVTQSFPSAWESSSSSCFDIGFMNLRELHIQNLGNLPIGAVSNVISSLSSYLFSTSQNKPFILISLFFGICLFSLMKLMWIYWSPMRPFWVTHKIVLLLCILYV